MTATSFEAISEGQTAKAIRVISGEVFEGFLQTFGDRNRIHTDDAFATSKGFESRVMHGAIVAGFVSAFVGMEFPGPNSLIQSIKIDFKKPNYLGDSLALEARVDQKAESVRTIILKIAVLNITRNYQSADVRVQLGML